MEGEYEKEGTGVKDHPVRPCGAFRQSRGGFVVVSPEGADSAWQILNQILNHLFRQVLNSGNDVQCHFVLISLD